ncbi:MAG: ATP-binding cassette domain-containing protein [Firmicutes bacterium]|nr:ATP-binding cassette domain-containing protein [Bacillota bacterium]
MLELKKIKKSYTTGNFTQHALKGINLEFRENEFVAILGPSGSGKTTLLNIIGGLDRYDSGDLIINNKSTKQFSDVEWDAYRNNCIGFIFQSYNLINHISVLENVEMGMTLSGVSASKRKKKALQVLKKVGLKDHAYKKPNQLSGGQMQRVAIARALANDPDIILADEPTGALDTNTSKQIMDLIEEIAKDKLVVMVTHNPELAKTYANRIVEFKDGALISDTNPVTQEEKQENSYNIKKTSMSFWTALKLSFNNIKTKKGRTLLTAFASSIGIIGIALILSLSNGFDIEIDNFQASTLSSMPIIISEQAMDLDENQIKELQNEMNVSKDSGAYPNTEKIYPLKSVQEVVTHTNILTKDYVDYIEKINSKYLSGLSYTRLTSLNMLIKTNDGYKKIEANSFNVTSIPKTLNDDIPTVITDNYDILKGKIPTNKNELLLYVDSKNRVDETFLQNLGVDTSKESISFEEIMDLEIKVILNNDFYKSLGNYFTINTDFETMYNSNDNVTLKIVGIVRGKEDKAMITSGTGIGYTEELVEYIVEKNSNSEIVKKQKEQDYNVLTGQKFDIDSESGMTKETILSYLGSDDIPVMINIYPKDFEAKDEIINYLDKYNNKQKEENKILYTDMAELISSLSGSIMDTITIVLIAFSAISLVVSSIMIGIITYISVLERTKEIGVLRALGARKKDITRVFNAETFIIGICSGALGIIIARLLIIPANIIIENMSGLPNVAKMNPWHAIMLIIISVILTIIGGFIPSKMAAKKDPVEALRTE